MKFWLMGFAAGWFACTLSLVLYNTWRGRQDRKKGKTGLATGAPFLAGEPLKSGDVVHVSPKDGRVYRGYSS